MNIMIECHMIFRKLLILIFGIICLAVMSIIKMQFKMHLLIYQK